MVLRFDLAFVVVVVVVVLGRPRVTGAAVVACVVDVTLIGAAVEVVVLTPGAAVDGFEVVVLEVELVGVGRVLNLLVDIRVTLGVIAGTVTFEFVTGAAVVVRVEITTGTVTLVLDLLTRGTVVVVTRAVGWWDVVTIGTAREHAHTEHLTLSTDRVATWPVGQLIGHVTGTHVTWPPMVRKVAALDANEKRPAAASSYVQF